MSFVYPWFLVSLAAIAIPILIHLFNLRRYKTVYFPDIRFIKQINQESKSKSKLKHLLVLISRILAIACLVFAFAQPFIPKSGTSNLLGRKAISVYVDNSYSMNLLTSEGMLLDEAKSKAMQIAKAYGNADLFQLITNDLKPEQNFLISKDQFLERLGEVKISTVSKNISEIYKRQKAALKDADVISRNAYMVSDFQQSTSDFSKIAADTVLNTFIVTVKPQQVNNISIDTCWFEAPVHQLNKNEKLHVRLKNIAASSVDNLPIKLLVNGVQKTIGSVSIQANSAAELTMSFLSSNIGINQCSLEITDYPITFDDKLYFTYTVQTQIPVLAINESAANVDFGKIFSKDTAFTFHQTNVKQIDYAALKNYRLIIFNQLKDLSSGLTQEILRFVENGGAVCVIPDENAKMEGYNELFAKLGCSEFEKSDTAKTEAATLNYAHPMFKNMFVSIPEHMDMPLVSMHFKMKKGIPKDEDQLIRLKNGDPMLLLKNYKKGKVYVFTNAIAPNVTNFFRHPLVVPVFWEIALSSLSQSKLFYTIGNSNVIEMSNVSIANEQMVSISKLEQSFIPEQQNVDNIYQLKVKDQIKEPGFYQILQNKICLGVASFNLDRKESDLTYLTNDAINKYIKDCQLKKMDILDDGHRDLTLTITQLNAGIRLWKIFILLALLFFAIEVTLLRFFK